MELALNVICLLIVLGSLSAWIVLWRRSRSSLILEFDRGLLVVGCILMLLLPAISISDDLAQSPVFAEGAKLQDLLKSPEQTIQLLLVAALFLAFFSPCKAVLWWEAHDSASLLEKLILWSPNIEMRPPPQFST